MNAIGREPTSAKQIALKEILEENPVVTLPPSAIDRLNGKYRDKPIISDPNLGDLAPTCVAHYSKDRGTRLVKDKLFSYGVRSYTPREYARLQGVPDWFQFAGTSNQIYKQIGNGVPVQIGQWVGDEINRYFGTKKKDIGLNKGACITHHARADKTETRIINAIEQIKKTNKKPSKAAVAKIIGMSREQVSRRYAHLFIAA